MPPTFSVRHVAALPPLSWCARIDRESRVDVTAGTAIDAGDEWFFEGAWAGPFGETGFLDQPCFGSGAVLRDGRLFFAQPDHILDRLFAVRGSKGLLLSNSLAFLLVESGLSLTNERSDYPVLFGNIRHGLDNSLIRLPTAEGPEIETYAFYNLEVTPDLEIVQHDKARHVDLPDFAAYRGFLSDCVRKIFDNASHPERRFQYSSLVSLSSGYDSTMIAVLAEEQGCRDAITFSRTRSKLGKPDEDDSGAEAAGVLGLDLAERDRLGFRARSDLPEIETQGAGSEMSSLADVVSGRVFLTGYMGDTMWDRVPKTQSDNITWPIIAGHNFGELRLSANFVNFCLPFLACRQQADVIRISQSPEMADWTLNTAYDRPICRRIAEERGISRGAFGLKKRAAGVFFREEGLEETMAPASYADYAAFRDANSAVSRASAQRVDRMWRIRQFANSAIAVGAKKAGALLGKTISAPQLRNDPSPKSEGALLFQWAADRMKKRYRAALGD